MICYMEHNAPMGYNHTLRACYIGYITQAVVNNFAPLLFLTFAATFSLSLPQITLITTVNFLVQLLVDLLSAMFIDKIGYRKSIVAGHISSAMGLAGLVILPQIMNPYMGIMIAVVLYAIGGGVIEVLISPIVESCPTEGKAAAMSLLHSFYCWGHLAVILLSTLFFAAAGLRNWRVLAFLWALVPIANTVYFCYVPIYTPSTAAASEQTRQGGLLNNRTFWLLFVLMICAGASEQGMSQWASAFAESALHVSKTVGDICGPAAFALCMGAARALYSKNADRLPLIDALTISSALCILCYVAASCAHSPVLALAGCALCGFSVGVFWPGTFSLASGALPKGGTAMYALLALAGDIGCASGPSAVGFVANACNKSLSRGLMAAMIFPIVLLAGVRMMRRIRT